VLLIELKFLVLFLSVLVISTCGRLKLSSLAMSTLAIWCRVVRSRDFSTPIKREYYQNCLYCKWC